MAWRFVYFSLLAIFVFALASVAAFAQPSDEAIWKNFMEWLNEAPPVDRPRILFELYQKQLIANGASDAEANGELAVVRQMHRQRPDGWRVMFNDIYKTAKPGFATQPNALLVTTVEGHKPGRALDVGIGQGRNSVFLALKGWDVTGFDMSDEGVATERKNAEQAGVKLNAIRETEDSFDYATHQWDLIVFMYEPFPVTSPCRSAPTIHATRQSGLGIGRAPSCSHGGGTAAVRLGAPHTWRVRAALRDDGSGGKHETARVHGGAWRRGEVADNGARTTARANATYCCGNGFP